MGINGLYIHVGMFPISFKVILNFLKLNSMYMGVYLLKFFRKKFKKVQVDE